MANSGTFYGTTSNQYVQPRIQWGATQSIQGNYTDVSAVLTYTRTNTGYTTQGTWKGSITIGGESSSGSQTVIITYGAWTQAIHVTKRIYHDADGTKSVTISATGSIPGTSVTSTTISETVTLNAIPRATTPTFSASTVNMNSPVTIILDRAASGFTHTLSYAFGNLTGQTAGLSASSGVETSATFTPPINLANQIPNTESAVCTITCNTYNGSTLIGMKSATLTVKVPTSVIPSITNVAVAEATAGLADKFGTFVQTKSALNVTITASGTYGSTITDYETFIESVSYRGETFTSNVITASGTITVLTKVTDSRGRTAQLSTPVTITAYSAPQISIYSPFRITSAGVEADEGNRIGIRTTWEISSVNGRNDHNYVLKYKLSTASTWTTFDSGIASLTYDGTLKFISQPEVSTDYAYNIRLELSDYFQTVVFEGQLATAFTIMDFRSTGHGIAFGKVSQKDAMEIAMDVDLTGEFLQEEKHNPTLLNGWTNYGASYEPASYWKDKCNVVHIGGLIKGGTTSAETVIFTLPVGYRPANSEKFFSVSLNAIAVIDVYSNGNVAIKTGANTGWLSLSGINFRA